MSPLGPDALLERHRLGLYASTKSSYYLSSLHPEVATLFLKRRGEGKECRGPSATPKAWSVHQNAFAGTIASHFFRTAAAAAAAASTTATVSTIRTSLCRHDEDERGHHLRRARRAPGRGPARAHRAARAVPVAAGALP